jgi:hypothetical protein
MLENQPNIKEKYSVNNYENINDSKKLRGVSGAKFYDFKIGSKKDNRPYKIVLKTVEKEEKNITLLREAFTAYTLYKLFPDNVPKTRLVKGNNVNKYYIASKAINNMHTLLDVIKKNGEKSLAGIFKIVDGLENHIVSRVFFGESDGHTDNIAITYDSNKEMGVNLKFFDFGNTFQYQKTFDYNPNFSSPRMGDIIYPDNLQEMLTYIIDISLNQTQNLFFDYVKIEKIRELVKKFASEETKRIIDNSLQNKMKNYLPQTDINNLYKMRDHFVTMAKDIDANYQPQKFDEKYARAHNAIKLVLTEINDYMQFIDPNWVDKNADKLLQLIIDGKIEEFLQSLNAIDNKIFNIMSSADYIEPEGNIRRCNNDKNRIRKDYLLIKKRYEFHSDKINLLIKYFGLKEVSEEKKHTQEKSDQKQDINFDAQYIIKNLVVINKEEWALIKMIFGVNKQKPFDSQVYEAIDQMIDNADYKNDKMIDNADYQNDNLLDIKQIYNTEYDIIKLREAITKITEDEYIKEIYKIIPEHQNNNNIMKIVDYFVNLSEVINRQYNSNVMLKEECEKSYNNIIKYLNKVNDEIGFLDPNWAIKLADRVIEKIQSGNIVEAQEIIRATGNSLKKYNKTKVNNLLNNLDNVIGCMDRKNYSNNSVDPQQNDSKKRKYTDILNDKENQNIVHKKKKEDDFRTIILNNTNAGKGSIDL